MSEFVPLFLSDHLRYHDDVWAFLGVLFDVVHRLDGVFRWRVTLGFQTGGGSRWGGIEPLRV